MAPSEPVVESPAHRRMLDQVETVTKEIVRLRRQTARLEARRSVLYSRARAMTPPITLDRLGQVSGVSQAAVSQMLRKMEERRNGTRPPRRI